MTPKEYSTGIDTNIGSTTDWPMESHVLRFDAASSRIIGAQSTVLGTQMPPLDYKPAGGMAGRYSELCRHIEAARKLAEADSSIYKAAWVSPPVTREQCERVQESWAENAKQLMSYQETISKRFDDESDYNLFILRVAAGASRYEYLAGRRIIP
jgi:hypothetical protein